METQIQIFYQNLCDDFTLPSNLIGFHNYGPQHLNMAVDFLSRTMDKYPYNELVSPPFDLHQMDDAVDLALKKKYLRVCVVPGQTSGH